MKLLHCRRHYASFGHHRHLIASQLIDFCRAGSVTDAITLHNLIINSSRPGSQDDISKPIAYAMALHACTKSPRFAIGLQFHCHIIKSGLSTDRFVGNSLLALYLKLGLHDLNEARKLFDELSYRDVVSWSSMVSGYIRAGRPVDAIHLYIDMIGSDVGPNAFTLSAVIKACSEVGDLELGRTLHGVVIRCGLVRNEVIIATLIDMYGKSHAPGGCRRLFDEMAAVDDVCCTSVISALTRCDLYREALGIFYRMTRIYGLVPDCFTFGSALTALGNLERSRQGRQVHARVVTGGFRENVFVGGSLVDMYAKCGMMEESRWVFDGTERKNSVLWCALLGGYCREGKFGVVVDLFRRYAEKSLYSFGTILRACAGLAAENPGREVHCQFLRRGGRWDVVAGSALVDLYGKCGRVDFAHRVFERMAVKNLITWNSMIGGLAQNGRSREAVEVFDRMVREGVRPDYISFVEVLSACSRSGLVGRGRELFVSMKEDYGVGAGIEHYSCMVDLLSRAGEIQEAESLIVKGEFEREPSLWAALLGACGGATVDPSVTERVARRVMRLRPDDHLSFVRLANVYREAGRWRDSEEIWSHMQRREMRKLPGKSLLNFAIV